MKTEMRNLIIACNELSMALAAFAESQKESPSAYSGYLQRDDLVSRAEKDALFPRFTESVSAELDDSANSTVPIKSRTVNIGGTLNEFKSIFARALNTADPHKTPTWAIDLSDLFNTIPIEVSEVKLNFTLKC